jgi:hypothetical protein
MPWYAAVAFVICLIFYWYSMHLRAEDAEKKEEMERLAAERYKEEQYKQYLVAKRLAEEEEEDEDEDKE